MFLAKRILLSLTALCSAAFLALAVIQPQMSAHLYVRLHDDTYLTADDRSGSWGLRIGKVGGVDGFELALTDTDQKVRQLRARYNPFPLNWYFDWCFDVQSRSPFFLLATPLYFPAVLLAIWPVCRIINRQRGRISLSRELLTTAKVKKQSRAKRGRISFHVLGTKRGASIQLGALTVIIVT